MRDFRMKTDVQISSIRVAHEITCIANSPGLESTKSTIHLKVLGCEQSQSAKTHSFAGPGSAPRALKANSTSPTSVDLSWLPPNINNTEDDEVLVAKSLSCLKNVFHPCSTTRSAITTRKQTSSMSIKM